MLAEGSDACTIKRKGQAANQRRGGGAKRGMQAFDYTKTLSCGNIVASSLMQLKREVVSNAWSVSDAQTRQRTRIVFCMSKLGPY